MKTHQLIMNNFRLVFVLLTCGHGVMSHYHSWPYSIERKHPYVTSIEMGVQQEYLIGIVDNIPVMLHIWIKLMQNGTDLLFRGTLVREVISKDIVQDFGHFSQHRVLDDWTPSIMLESTSTNDKCIVGLLPERSVRFSHLEARCSDVNFWK